MTVLSEDRLIEAYGRLRANRVSRVETRPCVCGGYVHADPDSPGRGVAAHQHTGRHKAWRATWEADNE